MAKAAAQGIAVRRRCDSAAPLTIPSESSGDGRFVAGASTESGGYEIYVSPLPNGAGKRPMQR